MWHTPCICLGMAQKVATTRSEKAVAAKPRVARTKATELAAKPRRESPRRRQTRIAFPPVPPASPSDSESELRQAFAAFTQVASSLESSYNQLRQELAEKNLENEKMRSQLVQILENLPCGVVVLDADSAVRLANPRARAIIDLSSDTLAALKQVSEGGEIEISISERRIGVTCTFRDGFSIYLLREVSEMALLLASEIRQPLGSLELFSGLIADSVDAHPETRQWCDHLQSGLRQISATVHNAIYHHGLPAVRPEPMNLTRLLRETTEFLRPVARQKGMRIELALDPAPIEIPAEAHTVRHVFFNIALNAFRAMSHGGVLTISTRRAENTAQIAFSDTGSGVAGENIARIFEAGFSTTRTPGLGLSVARAIVAAHGGEISASSNGPGAEFVIALPMKETA
jgi:signal transduction histidine kinase